MRTLAVISIIVPLLAVSAAVISRPEPREAQACTPAIPVLSEIARTAELIALVDVVEPFGAENPLPTLPPQPTMTPWPTDTPSTPPPTRAPFEPTATPTPTQPAPVRMPRDLTGVGATVRLVTLYVGDAPEKFDIDRSNRARIEELAREVESYPYGVIESCPITLGAAHFEDAKRYLILGDASCDDIAYAVLIEDTGPDAYIALDYYSLLPEHVFKRYFPGRVAESPSQEGYVFATFGGMPLDTFIRLLAELRGDTSIIIPPHTGSAGLRGAR